jgi:ethanolamine ammonia-lyase small subunit
VALVVGDGLSAAAVQQHALPTLQALRDALHGACSLSPVVLARQARVALADEVGELLQAAAVLILLGERPGLSAPDSLGAYLTFAPRVGRSDAERNCVSNIRPEGLPPQQAGPRIAWLLQEALRRKLSGVGLKDRSDEPVLGDQR